MTVATLIKGDFSLGLAYSFRGLVRYHRGGVHGDNAGRHGAGEGSENATYRNTDSRKGLPHWAWAEHLRPQSVPRGTLTPSRPDLLQQSLAFLFIKYLFILCI